MDLLANPAWHALTGPQASVAERHGPAARFEPGLSVFGALPDDRNAGGVVGAGTSWSDPAGWRS